MVAEGSYFQLVLANESLLRTFSQRTYVRGTICSFARISDV